RPPDDLAPAAALRACPAHGKKSLLIDHFTSAPAGGACDQAILRFCALTPTASALLETRHLDIDREATHGVLEADREVVADLVTALRAVAPLPRPAAEHIAETEDVTENFAQIGESGAIESDARGAHHALMAEAVVGRALLRIAQDAICLGGF